MLARMQKSMKGKDQGFTLIELLVVIVIIGILAAIAIPAFLSQRKKGVDAGLKSDAKNAATAAETAVTDDPNGSAFTAAELTAAGFKKSTGNTVQITGTKAAGYCIRALNASGSVPTGYIWYDSNAGGLQSGAPVATAPTGATTCTGTTLTWVTLS